MTAIDPNSTPGLAASASDAFTQSNALYFKAPTEDNVGYTVDDQAAYSLVGIVTETGEMKLCAFAAADGSQIPVGITQHAVAVAGASDSNSLADSNSAGTSDAADCPIWLDGEWNYDRVTLGAGWTLALLNRVCMANGRSLRFRQTQTATPTEPA